MMGWDLGWSAFTAASHVAIVLSVLIVFSELVYLQGVANARQVIGLPAVRLSVAAMFSALVVERVYYIGARLLSRTGVDLWGAHPAPELLAGLLAIAIFSVAATIMLGTASTLRRGLVTVAINGGGILLIWAIVAMALV